MAKPDPDRLPHAQAIVCAFAHGVTFTWDRGPVLSWQVGGKTVSRRWVVQSRGSSFPRWHAHRPFGGTCCVAVTQVVRWVRRQPVYPLRVWRYWCSPTVGMNAEALRLATAGGWPENVPCVLCGRVLAPSDMLDWYTTEKVDGPGCWYGTGCKVSDQTKEE